MIMTRTPFRMSFFGGGTDFSEFYSENGGAVLSTTFDKYCYVTVRRIPALYEHKTLLSYSKTEKVKSVDEIQHPLIREAMKWLKVEDIKLLHDADLPARSGLGTSSAFAVGILNAFYAMNGIEADKRRLADDAIYLERVLCREAGGIQDQIATSFGGFNRIDFSDKGYTVTPVNITEERKKELNGNLMMFFTGFSRMSFDIHKETKIVLPNRTAELKELLSLVDEAQKILESDSPLSDFGRLLDTTWGIKKRMTSSVSTELIDGIYQKAIAAGALGGKLLGAGGGGFFIFYVEPDKRESVRGALRDLLSVAFEFENTGSTVVTNTKEDFNDNN